MAKTYRIVVQTELTVTVPDAAAAEFSAEIRRHAKTEGALSPLGRQMQHMQPHEQVLCAVRSNLREVSKQAFNGVKSDFAESSVNVRFAPTTVTATDKEL
ncbi:hypothetical protein Loshitsa2_00025 [Erwinia phage Loshitsa2]|uniref:Uncharacterized protein n=2 Tax=Micantvirus TaxID=3424950 RepID=A0AAE9FQ81_9CAUD|nr:hypothetical protein Micant_00025 [Erwinia phage Micant]UNA01153.1 hypothetical protein Loshitsa2_00025 [Erwinia phage Loshitsa2]